MKRLAILGASGHGKVVAELAETTGYDAVVFFDDASPVRQTNGHWVVNGASDQLLLTLSEFHGVVVAIGNNEVRKRKVGQLQAEGVELVSLIHPTATVSRYAEIGAGTVIFANAVVNVGATIGDGAIVNTGAIVEHDCSVGAFCHLSPNATLAGGVKVGDLSWIGAGATVKQLVSVGSSAIVGMGSVVLRDVPAGVTVVGNPAVAQKITQNSR